MQGSYQCEQKPSDEQHFVDVFALKITLNMALEGTAAASSLLHVAFKWYKNLIIQQLSGTQNLILVFSVNISLFLSYGPLIPRLKQIMLLIPSTQDTLYIARLFRLVLVALKVQTSPCSFSSHLPSAQLRCNP